MASAGGRAATLVAVLVMAASCGQTPPVVEIPPATCDTDRVIVMIHGTGSTGEFHPDGSVVAGSEPHPDVFTAQLNGEFDRLLADVGECRRLTFSYDDRYLTQSGQITRGVHAWNLPRSPWNRFPPELADHLDLLLDEIRGSSSPPPRVMLVAFSAGGAVATYWAATRKEQMAAKGVDHVVVLDGIVSGHDAWWIELACLVLGNNLLQHDFFGLGKLPCHFRFGGQYTRVVRESLFWDGYGTTLATIRADGDMIVWHRSAGLNPSPPSARDTTVGSYWSCTQVEWDQASWGARIGCIARHGSVLIDTAAKRAFHQLIP